MAVGQAIIGALLLAVGVCSAATALVPRRRGSFRWRSGARLGVISGLGIGTIFIGGGTLACFDQLLPPGVHACCGAAVLLGFPTTLVGDWLDHRRPRR